MTRNGTWLVAAVAACTAAAGADEALVERWDKPRVESFALRGAPPKDVLADISARYGVAVRAAPMDLPAMDFEAADVTFFEALDRLASAHGLLVTGWPVGERPLALGRPGRRLPAMPVAHIGPSRLAVQSVSLLAATHWTIVEPKVEIGAEDVTSAFSRYTRDWMADLAEAPRMRVGFQWMTEPGFEQVALVGWDIRRAEDDTGAGIAVTVPPGLPLAANHSFSVDFEAPRRSARSIARLEGRMRVALPLREGEVEFKADEARRTKPLGDARVKLEDVDAEGAVVRLSIEGAPCGPLKPCMAELRRHDVRVGSRAGGAPLSVTVIAYDADGAEVAGSLMRTWSDVNFPSVTYWIDLERAPARIVLRSTTTALVRELPFSFTKIPLP